MTDTAKDSAGPRARIRPRRGRVATGALESIPDFALSSASARRAYLVAREAHGGPGHGDTRLSHPVAVATLLGSRGFDETVVSAALLHDTVEDTPTTEQELTATFGPRVAALVVEVTDDMTLPKPERRRRQVVDAPHKSPDAKLIKIADKISNIRARILPEPSQSERDDLIDYVGWAVQVVAGCRGVNAMLDRTFDDTVQAARSTL